MKKIISVALALALVLSLGVSAFAAIGGKDADGKDITQSPVNGDAKWVRADESGDDLTVNGSVNENETGNRDSIYAKGSGTEVTVKGDVTEEGDGNAIYAQEGATVIVYCNVSEKDGGSAINATKGSKVIVGGNVTENGGNNIAVLVNGENTKVIIEGTVKVDGKVTVGGALYLGELVGDISKGTENNVHYLLGTASDSKYGFGDVALTEGSDIIDSAKTIEGVEKEGVKKVYLFTSTADPTTLKDKTITLKPNDSNKILTVSGFDGANVKYVANENGTVTFTIGENFKGGMQNLVLILADKPGPGPDPTPVYYIVPLGSVTTASVKLPEGVAEGLIKALDSADHAGITVDSSLVGDGSVKVLKDGKELSAKDFSIYTHADGSIDVIMSNTYLYALGSGSYDFTAVVGGTEIGFSVLVAV